MKQWLLTLRLFLIFSLFSPNLFANDIKVDEYSQSQVPLISSDAGTNHLDDLAANTESAPADNMGNAESLDAVREKVIGENRMVSNLDSASFFTLPLGISAGGDKSDDYAIIIDKATIHPEFAEFSAFMVLTNPMDGKKVRFRADKIRFTFKGGLTGNVNLMLMDTLSTSVIKDVKFNWLPKSYVEWDCKGFKQIGLNGEIELCSKTFVKVNPLTFEEIGGKIKNSFFLNIADFNNFILSTSLPSFKIKGFDEVCFTFDDVTLDNSDLANLPGFSFPAKYPGNYVGDKTTLWRGLSIKKAKVTLSPKFNKKSGAQTSFYAKDLIVDENGFTGFCGVDNPLGLDEGQLGNWKLSIAHLELAFFTGEFKSFTMKGSTVLPGTSSPLDYSAFFDVAGAFKLSVTLLSNIKFDMLAAHITLLKTSIIEVGINDKKKFVPKAILDGSISFACTKDTTSSSVVAKMPKIAFQQMTISSVPPVFTVAYFGFESKDGLKFKNFPITITKMAFRNRGDYEASIDLGLKVNLSESENEGLGGELGFAIVADTHHWKFKGLEITKISVHASKPGAYTIDGSIEIKDDDPTYGDAFRGQLKAVFGGDFGLEAVALFGNKDGLRYFLVDAFISLGDPGIPCGPFILNGFGGGLYYRMRQTLPSENLGSDFGKGLSDIIYVPDATKFIGIKAALKAGVVKKELVDAKISFEINFTNSGGIAQIAFLGDARILSLPIPVSEGAVKAMTQLAAKNQKQVESQGEMLRAVVSIQLDFEQGIYDNSMELYLNLAGVLTGIGPNNRAGWCQMHIDTKKHKWFIHMGTPTDPIGINFVGLMQVGGYFMAGDDIPDAVALPATVLEILNMTQDDFTGKREKNQISSGKGLAFGAFFALDTGEKSFLIFYARLQFGGGFDVFMIDYGKNAVCAGKTNRIGINGWYAKGSAYTYFNGDIGLQAKVFGKKKKFTILNLATAAVICLEGPNPIYFRGVVGGRYNVLGGMIKGDCHFEVTMGTKCDIQDGSKTSDLSDVEIISDFAPKAKATGVDVFTLPQVVFNLPVNVAANISEDPKSTQQFKVVLNELALFQGTTLVPGDFAWDAEKKTVAFTPATIFSPNTKYKIVAKAGFQQKDNAQSAWVDFKDESGKVYTESKEVEFETGALPDKIPDNYITYTYPIHRMSNFYKQESNTAYVTFKADLLPFFQPLEGWKQQVRWTPVGKGAAIYSDLSYNQSRKSAETTVPSPLVNSTVYRMELVNTPLSSNNSVSRNITTSTSQQLATEDNNSAEVTTRKAMGVISNSEEKAFYGLAFRSSKFNKFFDKISATELNVRFLYNVKPGLDYPGATVYGTEMLDGFEIVGNSTLLPLVSCEAVLAGADWYQANIYPLMYANYPLAPLAKVARDTTINGIPPTRPVNMWQEFYNYQLSDADIESGKSSSGATLTHFVYYVPGMWADDYTEIRNNLSNLVSQNRVVVTPAISKILHTFPWPQVSVGNYPIVLKYHLPGRNTVTSTKKINIKNSIDVKQVNLLSND